LILKTSIKYFFDVSNNVAEEKPQDQDEKIQLRLWKERSSRMEILLAKKSAKIQEMEETVRLFT
jgi:hypothetical protein